MAPIAALRLQWRSSIDRVAASVIAAVLGLSGLLVIHYGDAGLTSMAMAAATAMLMAAVAIGVRSYRRSKEESSETYAMMRMFTEALPHPAMLKNIEGEVLFANAAAQGVLQHFGVMADKLQACPLSPMDAVAPRSDLSAGYAISFLSPMARMPWRSSKGSLLGWVELLPGIDGNSHRKQMIAERELEDLVTQRTANIRELMAYVESCREQEKKAIASRLHGELGSSLTALSMHIAILSRHVSEQPSTQKHLQQMKEALATAAETNRRIQSGLRPDKLELFGLAAAVEELADSMSMSTGTACELHFPAEMQSYPADLEIALYRMVEEALRNVAQHACATQVDISLEEREAQLTVSIRDNGVGFSVHDLPASAHGLRCLRERAVYLGGSAEIQSAPGKGTCISIILPVLRQTGALLQDN